MRLIGVDPGGVGPSGWLGGVALIIAAIGGAISAVLAVRRPQSREPDLNATLMWQQMLEQLDQRGEERDEAEAERARVIVERDHLLERLEACDEERLRLLRKAAESRRRPPEENRS